MDGATPAGRTTRPAEPACTCPACRAEDALLALIVAPQLPSPLECFDVILKARRLVAEAAAR